MESQEDLVKKIAKANGKLALKVDKQTDYQEQLSEQLSAQGESTKQIEKRMESQEALTEKVVRQMGDFRSVLFERTNYLSEKIEETYSYILSQLTDCDQIHSNFLLYESQKQKEKSK